MFYQRTVMPQKILLNEIVSALPTDIVIKNITKTNLVVDDVSIFKVGDSVKVYDATKNVFGVYEITFISPAGSFIQCADGNFTDGVMGGDYLSVFLNDISKPDISDLSTNISIREFLYNTVIDNFACSEIMHESGEQFKYWFKTYWNRVIPKYLPLFIAQLTTNERLLEFQHESKGGTYETKQTGSDTESTNFGRKLTHTRELTETETPAVAVTEDNTTTEYEQQTVETKRTTTPTGVNTRDLGGSYENSNSGVDSTTNEYGKIVTITDTRTNQIVQYDYDKLIKAISTVNVLDAFIDEFRLLFTEVLYAE